MTVEVSVVVIGLLLTHQVAGQTRELLPNYIGEENQPALPPSTILAGKVVELNEIDDKIELRNSKAELNCAEGFIDILLKFDEPFNGLVYPNDTRFSPCTVIGTGEKTLKVKLPLRGCETREYPSRVFTTTINVRYHPQLKYDIDERLTVVCRYPPPIAPPPLAGLPYVADPPPAPVSLAPMLSGTNIILIICAILFLALLLLGLGFGYACVKRRKISFIKHVPPPISTLSPSDLSQLSLPFDALKIPRAHALQLTDDATSSETIPSDYPSESLSDLEQVDAGIVVPTRSFITTEELLNTTYTDKTVREEVDIQRQPHLMIKQPNDQALLTTEQIINTTLLSTQLHDTTEVHRQASALHHNQQHQNLHQVDVHQSEVIDGRMPEAKFQVHPPATQRASSVSESETFFTEMESVGDMDMTLTRGQNPRLNHHDVDDLIRTTVTETKIHEDIERRRRAVREYYARQQKSAPPDWDVEIRQYGPDRTDTSSSHWEESSVGTDVAPIPNLSGYTVDGEKRTRDQFASFSSNLQQPTSVWNRSSNAYHSSHAEFSINNGALLNLGSGAVEPPIKPTSRGPTPPRRQAIPSMDVLIRVLSSPSHHQDDQLSELTDDERATLCHLITNDQEFRSLLTETHVEDQFERSVQHSRYARLLPPSKWHVIFRVIAPITSSMTDPEPSEFSETVSRAASDVVDYSEFTESLAQRTNRNRRRHGDGSALLPPVYESDGSPTQFTQSRSTAGSARSYNTNVSSFRGDVRSVTEDTVNFHRYPGSETEDSAPSPRQTLAQRVNFIDEWSSIPQQPPSSSFSPQNNMAVISVVDSSNSNMVNSQSHMFNSSSSMAQYYTADSALIRNRESIAASSTVGDKEELYSVAETDVDWQRRPF